MDKARLPEYRGKKRPPLVVLVVKSDCTLRKHDNQILNIGYGKSRDYQAIFLYCAGVNRVFIGRKRNRHVAADKLESRRNEIKNDPSYCPILSLRTLLVDA